MLHREVLTPRQMSQRYLVRVWVDAPAEAVRRAVGHWTEVTAPADGEPGSWLVMNVDDLPWLVMVLARLDAPIRVEAPDELREALRRTAQLFLAAT